MNASSATIMFCDIVGFSKKSTSDQRGLVDEMTIAIAQKLKPFLAPSSGYPTLIALPTGDGMALAFLHSQEIGWDRSTLLEITLNLHRWANTKSTANSSVSMRVGVHVGPVELITDINGKKNVCGHTINFAQRVMDAANPRQTLFSEEAFAEYIGTESPVLSSAPFSAFLQGRFDGPIDLYAKHGLQINVYKLVLEPAQAYYSNEDPVARHLMLVGLTPLPKEIVGSFSDRLAKAHDIAFIQLTGDRFLARWEAGEINFSPQLRRFWVFMPEPDAYSVLKLESPHASAEFVHECVKKWRELFAKLRKDFPKAELKLGLFLEPPYYGASLVDWDEPGGKIHVSPYIWGTAAPECPGYDVDWIGRRRPEIYYRYVRGLEHLHCKTRNILS